jgi:hypothetical protein
MALNGLIEENQELRDRLSASETTIAALQKNLATANAEGKSFGGRRASLSSAGGIGDRECRRQRRARLLKAVSDMKLLEDERKSLSDA